MNKLYKVLLKDTEDGGHVLDEAIFGNAKEARNEFLRIKSKIFDGYHCDQPGEYSWHDDDHFTIYRSLNLELFIKTINVGNHIKFLDEEEKQIETIKFSLFENPDNKYRWTINSLFTYLTTDVSNSFYNYNKGFKKIYNGAKRVLGDTLTKCIYSEEEETNPATMDYFIETSDHGEVIVTVVRDGIDHGTYGFMIAY